MITVEENEIIHETLGHLRKIINKSVGFIVYDKDLIDTWSLKKSLIFSLRGQPSDEMIRTLLEMIK